MFGFRSSWMLVLGFPIVDVELSGVVEKNWGRGPGNCWLLSSHHQPCDKPWVTVALHLCEISLTSSIKIPTCPVQART